MIDEEYYCFNIENSGLGDRFLELFLRSILLHKMKQKALAAWGPFNTNETNLPLWRFIDTDIENVQSFFNLPPFLELMYNVVSEENFGTETIILHAYCTPPLQLKQIYSQLFDSMTEEEYKDHVKEVREMFSLKIPSFTHPKPYAVLHLRRSDKISSKDCFMTSPEKLDELNRETCFAIDRAVEKGIDTFYLATDDLKVKEEYKQFLRFKNLNILEPENSFNLLPSYFDLWIMKSASFILQSIQYSTFSLLPCVFWNVPLWTVVPNSQLFEYGFHLEFPIIYYKNVQLSSLGC